MKRTLFIGSLLCLTWPLQASPVQLQQGESARSLNESTSEQKEAPAELRIQQIESARAEKEANLEPEAEPHLQHDINWVQSTFPYRLMTSQIHGFGLGFGQLVSGAGFALGPQFSRTDLLNGKLALRVSARGSTNRSYLGGLDLSFHDLMGGHAFLNFGAVHRDLSEMPYYGAGPDSLKSGRSDYRLEDTTVELRPGITPFRHVRAGLIGAYSKVNVGPGHSTQYISTERQYSPEVAPGIDRQTDFWRGGGFLEYDWRDRSWAPTSGGKYSAQYTRSLDRKLDSFSFLRLDFDATQYIPLVNHTRVITLHGATSLTKTNGSQQVPFYLQPTLGGPETLRGYRAFRFYGNNSVLVNAEYRWEVSPTFSVTGFADAGRVFDRWAQWNLHNAESDVGFGVAFRTESKIVFRIDTGFSHEGVQVWFRANNMF
jgi:outer membrane protein assembly factor BamA